MIIIYYYTLYYIIFSFYYLKLLILIQLRLSIANISLYIVQFVWFFKLVIACDVLTHLNILKQNKKKKKIQTHRLTAESHFSDVFETNS
jgi:hypothetical protein